MARAVLGAALLVFVAGAFRGVTQLYAVTAVAAPAISAPADVIVGEGDGSV